MRIKYCPYSGTPSSPFSHSSYFNDIMREPPYFCHYSFNKENNLVDANTNSTTQETENKQQTKEYDDATTYYSMQIDSTPLRNLKRSRQTVEIDEYSSLINRDNKDEDFSQPSSKKFRSET